jgi:hypothetical protein
MIETSIAKAEAKLLEKPNILNRARQAKLTTTPEPPTAPNLIKTVNSGEELMAYLIAEHNLVVTARVLSCTLRAVKAHARVSI